jgi:hypothetical protein
MKFQHGSGRETYPLALAEREWKEKIAVARDQPGQSAFRSILPEDLVRKLLPAVPGGSRLHIRFGCFLDRAWRNERLSSRQRDDRPLCRRGHAFMFGPATIGRFRNASAPTQNRFHM